MKHKKLHKNIMDYEKAYKEALETARKINNGDGVAAPADWTVCETIFPVLREDYDERMINRIIDLIKEIGEDDSYHVYHYDDMLEWLEKQKSIDVLDKEEREFADNVDAFRKEIDAAYQRGYEEGKRQNKCKFSVGDIVKHSLYDGLYYIVKSIDLAGGYKLECLNGKSGNNIASATEKYLSLWTIKDAKPGDVLTDGDMFVIFKSNNHDPMTQHGCMFVYCSMMKNNSGWHEFWYESGGLNPTYYLPATKEQRDLLFQKMKEADYVWDAEKKELRKINSYCEKHCKGYQETGKCFADSDCKAKREAEQKPVWSEEDRIRITNCIQLIGKTGDGEVEWLKSLESRILPQTKQEWSEEDEKILDGIIADVEFLKEATITKDGRAAYQREIDFLKSLKYRVQPQQEKDQKPYEWSEEDKHKLHN